MLGKLPGESYLARALVVYGTRFGATTGTSEEIAGVLRRVGMDVLVVSAKKEKVQSVSGYDLIVVGSGMMMDRWTGEAEGFLKRFQRELTDKRVALFVSSGVQAIVEYGGNLEEKSRGRRKYLEEVAEKYGLHPVALGLFGGVWDYNRMPLWVRLLPAAKNLMEENRRKLAAASFKEAAPGVYDTRNIESIRTWARSLVS